MSSVEDNACAERSRSIPKGWIETTIGELVGLAQGVAINAKTKHVLSDKKNGIPLLKINNLLNNTIDQYANPDLVPKQSIIHENDVIFTRTGQVGEVLKNKYGILHNNSFKVIPNEKVYWNYLYWYLKNKKIYNYVQKVASGSVQKDLNHSAFKTIEFKFPKNIDEQKAIAKVLTAFDDKIENLRAQNQTLEQTAQALFKEWFGNYQIDDELPEGWRFENLDEIAEHLKDNIKPFNEPEKEFIHYSLPAYDDSLRPVKERGIEIKSNKYSVAASSFLVSKLNPFTPRIWTIYKSEENHICSTEFQVVKPSKDIYFSLIHCFLNSTRFTNELSQKVKGTSSSHQRVNPKDIFDVKLIIPEEEALIKFNKIVDSMILKKNVNHQQIQTLTQTRDTLLPKLMRGKLRVNEFKD